MRESDNVASIHHRLEKRTSTKSEFWHVTRIWGDNTMHAWDIENYPAAPLAARLAARCWVLGVRLGGADTCLEPRRLYMN